MKFYVSSISAFSSAAKTYAIQKSAEESKDKEEESLEKSKKQLFSYDYLAVVYQHPAATDNSPQLSPLYQLRIGTFPPRNVPTPPPDSLS